jgi:hypothetical protein
MTQLPNAKKALQLESKFRPPPIPFSPRHTPFQQQYPEALEAATNMSI